ncbi:MAG: glycosyltransferase family 4 protein [Elusimicrobia bacterium]|nr:glycosyltransferase family 4 protein [Elusimicrobiota bacterium]
MKIAYALRNFTLLSGASRTVAAVAQRLSRWGHEVSLSAHRFPPLGVWQPGAIRLHRIPMLSFSSWLRAASFNYFAGRSLCRLRPDIRHGHGDLLGQDVLTLHNCDAALAYHTNGLHKISAGTRYLRKRQLHGNSFRILTVPSQRMRKDLVEFERIGEEGIRVIYPGVDLERFHPDLRAAGRKNLARELGIAEAGVWFLSVLSGDPLKRNLSGLLEAFQALSASRPALLFILGPRKLRPRFSHPRILWLPPTPAPEQVLAACDAYLLCAHYEEFGMPVLEAMACGVPAVVSRSSGAAELVESGKNGWILENPRSREELLHRMEGVIQQDLSELRRNARKTAENFSWDRTARQFLSLYQELSP